MVGVWRDPNGNVQRPQSPSCSYGPDYTFGTIKLAQARGDFEVLSARGRRLLRVHLSEATSGLQTLRLAISEALR